VVEKRVASGEFTSAAPAPLKLSSGEGGEKDGERGRVRGTVGIRRVTDRLGRVKAVPPMATRDEGKEGGSRACRQRNVTLWSSGGSGGPGGVRVWKNGCERGGK